MDDDELVWTIGKIRGFIAALAVSDPDIAGRYNRLAVMAADPDAIIKHDEFDHRWTSHVGGGYDSNKLVIFTATPDALTASIPM